VDNNHVLIPIRGWIHHSIRQRPIHIKDAISGYMLHSRTKSVIYGATGSHQKVRASTWKKVIQMFDIFKLTAM